VDEFMQTDYISLTSKAAVQRKTVVAETQRKQNVYSGESVKASSMRFISGSSNQSIFDDFNQTSCGAGEFIELVSFAESKCTPCFPGTYSEDGKSVHSCSGRCKKSGHSSYYGAISASACSAKYELMVGKTCEGSLDTIDERALGRTRDWPWKNKGTLLVLGFFFFVVARFTNMLFDSTCAGSKPQHAFSCYFAQI
jgi:hypothetical protein